MKSIIFSLSLIACGINAYSTTHITSASGSWTTGTNWFSGVSPGTYWAVGDTVIVNHNMTLSSNMGFVGVLIVNPGGSITSTRNLSLGDGASLIGNGPISVKDYSLISVSTAIHDSSLTVNNNLTIGTSSSLITYSDVTVSHNFANSGGTFSNDGSLNVTGDLNNNNGTMTFNGEVNIGDEFNNLGSSAIANINGTFTTGGDIENNSGATLNISSSGDLNVGGNFVNNNAGSSVNNEGRIDATGNVTNNGGDFQNNGPLTVGGDFTQFGGNFINDGGMLVEGTFTVGSGATVDGTGVLRTNNITNFGSITGSMDICRIDDSTPTTQTGGGSYSGSTTYCTISSSGPLPIELKEFNGAYISNKQIELKWVTISEINNDYFDLFLSEDGKEFKYIKSIQGAGNSTQQLTYQTSVEVVTNQNLYFKLSQTDFDGTTETFSPIVVTRNSNFSSSSKGKVAIYPNPGNGENITLELTSFKTGHYTFSLLDNTGKEIVERNIILLNSNEKIELNIQNDKHMKTGIYFITIRNTDTLITDKYVVK